MKPNWALIAIIAGFVVTISIVLVIVLSPPTYTGPELPTTTATFDSTAATATLEAHDDGCFYVSIDGAESYAIWPDGFTRDGSAVVAADGTRYVDGDTLTGSAFTSDLDSVVGDDEYLDRVSTSCGATDVTVFATVG